MGTTLHLAVPEDDQDTDVIRAYYSYVLQKYANLDTDDTMNEDWIKDSRARQLQMYEVNNEFSLFESVPSGLGVNDTSNSVFKLMRVMYDQPEEDVAEDPEALEEIIDILREIKAELKEIAADPDQKGSLYTPDDQEAQFETEPIALCEFALKNGYGIRIEN